MDRLCLSSLPGNSVAIRFMYTVYTFIQKTSPYLRPLYWRAASSEALRSLLVKLASQAEKDSSPSNSRMTCESTLHSAVKYTAAADDGDNDDGVFARAEGARDAVRAQAERR